MYGKASDVNVWRTLEAEAIARCVIWELNVFGVLNSHLRIRIRPRNDCSESRFIRDFRIWMKMKYFADELSESGWKWTTFFRYRQAIGCDDDEIAIIDYVNQHFERVCTQLHVSIVYTSFVLYTYNMLLSQWFPLF